MLHQFFITVKHTIPLLCRTNVGREIFYSKTFFLFRFKSNSVTKHILCKEKIEGNYTEC